MHAHLVLSTTLDKSIVGGGAHSLCVPFTLYFAYFQDLIDKKKYDTDTRLLWLFKLWH